MRFSVMNALVWLIEKVSKTNDLELIKYSQLSNNPNKYDEELI